ncbi:hypothetical protein AVEN_47776-1 [Araneus ventricosus]|uniref:Uncharacterized protein n=1 Tax=Araneus ventricosus TaxID=182803 RepID=A0A4Y2UFW7_ARAVE|nr:hypothetical protein AVEN_47776-1 [Araneus ventricosus]
MMKILLSLNIYRKEEGTIRSGSCDDTPFHGVLTALEMAPKSQSPIYVPYKRSDTPLTFTAASHSELVKPPDSSCYAISSLLHNEYNTDSVLYS